MVTNAKSLNVWIGQVLNFFFKLSAFGKQQTLNSDQRTKGSFLTKIFLLIIVLWLGIKNIEDFIVKIVTTEYIIG